MHQAQAANQQLLHVKVTNLSAATLAMLMAKTASFAHPASLGLAAAWWDDADRWQPKRSHRHAYYNCN